MENKNSVFLTKRTVTLLLVMRKSRKIDSFHARQFLSLHATPCECSY